MELYYPVKPAFVNQPFGANPNTATNAIYIQQGLKGHPGIDFKASHGQAIYASHDGTCFPTIDDHGGNGVILHADPIFKNFFTLYWHLIQDDAVVQTGQKVKAGDLLGYADSTGVSTGDHLHFGLTIYDGVNYNNGYGGKTDPTPFFNGKFAQDINSAPRFQFTKTLKMGSWNKEVRELQNVLKELLLYAGAIDGVFGPKTQLAVRDFQTNNGLLRDGIVGPKTLLVLNEFLK